MTPVIFPYVVEYAYMHLHGSASVFQLQTVSLKTGFSWFFEQNKDSEDLTGFILTWRSSQGPGCSGK